MSHDFLVAEARRIRLRILQVLADDPRGSSTVMMLTLKLKQLGYRKTDEFVLNQLRYLETETLAVRLIDSSIVTLLSAGRQHVDGTKFLVGVDEVAEET